MTSEHMSGKGIRSGSQAATRFMFSLRFCCPKSLSSLSIMLSHNSLIRGSIR